MKKISKVLALATAVVMMFGATLTVSAAPSVETATKKAMDVAKVTATTADGTTVTVAAVTETVATSAQTAAKEVLKDDNATVAKVMELTATLSGATDITINVDGITAGQKVDVLHFNGSTWEKVKVKSVKKGAVTATFTSLSPVAIVTYGTSDKTGATTNTVAVVCLISLVGAALCVKKYVLN